MREAVIVSAARTGIGKAFRGSLNKTHGAPATIGEKVRKELYWSSNGKQKFKTTCKSRTEITQAIRPEAC